MYIFKNAYKTIVRNKGRNILIGLIVIVVSAAVSITLAIRNSANKIVEAYESEYEVEATIEMNRQNLMKSFKEESSSQEEMIEQFNDIESLSVEELDTYADSKYVKSYYYTYEVSMNAEDIDEATDSLVKETTKTETETKSWGSDMPSMPMGGGFGGSQTTKKTTTTEKIYNDKAANGAFTIVGYNSYESMSEFIDGTYTISDGSVFTDLEGNGCIISEELATLNELSVGDTITLVNPDDDDKTYEVEITGIYTENSESSGSMNSMFSNSANKIITTTSVVNSIKNDDEDISLTVTPTYVLNDVDSAELFAEEVKEKGLSDYYTVTDNTETVTNATSSISNVKTFATTFLIITLIIGAVVLLVINMINIRERKYEIGVLRTIGMKKSLVISQFVFELLSVSVIALVIGCIIGSTSSVSIANSLLANEIENASEQMENVNKNFGGMMEVPDSKPDEEETEETNTEENDTEETDTEDNEDETTKEESTSKEQKNFVGDNKLSGFVNINKVDSINAVVDFKVLLELFGIIIALSMVSSISACIAISRFSPLDILKERS